MLIEYFVQGYATRAGKHFQSINKKTLELLHSCGWPNSTRPLGGTLSDTENSLLKLKTQPM